MVGGHVVDRQATKPDRECAVRGLPARHADDATVEATAPCAHMTEAASRLLANARTKDGHLLCPECRNVIRISGGVKFRDSYALHVRCPSRVADHRSG
jgi:hypothetical protein